MRTGTGGGVDGLEMGSDHAAALHACRFLLGWIGTRCNEQIPLFITIVSQDCHIVTYSKLLLHSRLRNFPLLCELLAVLESTSCPSLCGKLMFSFSEHPVQARLTQIFPRWFPQD